MAWQASALRHLEVELQKKLFALLIPRGEEFPVGFVDFSTGHLESNSFVWLCGHEQILPCLVRCLSVLLICRHETMTWSDIFRNFRVIDLKEKTVLLGDWVSLLSDLVARPANLHKLLQVDSLYGWLGQRHGILGLFSCSSAKVLLMLFSLCVCQVAAFVVVESEA